MRSKNFALLAFAMVLSIATAAATLALDHAGIFNLFPAAENAREQTISGIDALISAEPTPAGADRFAYAPLNAVALLAPPSAEEPLADEAALTDEVPPADEPSVVDEPPLRGTSEPDMTGSWLAEIQPERVGHPDEAQSRPLQSQPWRTSKPRMMSRSYALTKRLAQISPAASPRLAKKFEAAGLAGPPSEIALVAIKDEKILELFARSEGGEWQFIHRYPVLAASGRAGPKLRQGDKQVPEGIYRISFLNPNSRYHVSLRVNYPNAFDRRMAEAEGRSNLGGDIMIHGKAVSVGCLAVGDEAAEELFVLAADVGMENIRLIIAPTDFRRRGVPPVAADQPKWLPELYTEVAAAMSEFKSPPPTSLLSFFWN